MPTNIGYEYGEARKKFEAAKTDEEKLVALEEMWRHSPKHKGAEVLRREISKKLGEFRRKIDKRKEFEKTKKSGGSSLNIKKEGAGQIAVIGLPNTGKSTLLRILTGISVEIQPYEFTTVKPEVGMLDFKGVKIQLVEVPALIEGSSLGRANGVQLLSMIRTADALLIPCRTLNDFKTILNELEAVQIRIIDKKPELKAVRSSYGGVQLVGTDFLNVSEQEALEFIRSYGHSNLKIVIQEPLTLKQLADALNPRTSYLKTFILCYSEHTKQEIIDFVNSIKRNEVELELKEQSIKELKVKLAKKVEHSVKQKLEAMLEAELAKLLEQKINLKTNFNQRKKIELGLRSQLNVRLNARFETEFKKQLDFEVESNLPSILNQKLSKVKFNEANFKVKFIPKENLVKDLTKELFDLLDLVMVFTKPPGKEPDFKTPLVMKKGNSIEDIAKILHKDFSKKLKYVRVWGSTKFAGQRVSRDFKPSNEDIIEFAI